MADAIGKYGPAQGGSYVNTVNPFSTAMGLVDRLPAWWMSNFADTPEGRRTGMLTFKAGATALTAAAAVAAWRAWKHRGKLRDIESDSAAAELGQQLNTTFEPEMYDVGPLNKGASMEKKGFGILAGLGLLAAGAAAAGGGYWLYNRQTDKLRPGEVPAGGVTDLGTNLKMSLVPLASAILAGYGTKKYLDKKYNREVGLALDRNLAIKNRALQNAVLTRAQVARHEVPQDYMNDTLGTIEGALDTDSPKQRINRRRPLPYGVENTEAYSYLNAAKPTHDPFSWDSIKALPGEMYNDARDFLKGASLDKQAIDPVTLGLLLFGGGAVLGGGGILGAKALKDRGDSRTSMWTQAKGAYATLAALALMTSWYGAHKYFGATNENNIKFKAFKKGLNEYAKTKTLASPITTLPADAKDYFKAIDEGVPATSDGTPVESAPTVQPEIPQSPSIEASKAVMRTAPTVLDDDMNKPISVTI